MITTGITLLALCAYKREWLTEVTLVIIDIIEEVIKPIIELPGNTVESFIALTQQVLAIAAVIKLTVIGTKVLTLLSITAAIIGITILRYPKKKKRSYIPWPKECRCFLNSNSAEYLTC